MYVRKIEGKETTFGVTGTLWRDALVFFDRETDSYWSQINGTAIRGDHEGKVLSEIPSVLTTWGDWKRRHPDTLVLHPGQKSRDGSRYADYFESPDYMGALGTTNPDPRLPGKTLVLGIQNQEKTVAITLDALTQRAVVQGKIGEAPLLAVSVAPRSGFAFDRSLDGNVLDFHPRVDGLMVDAQTGSIWDPSQGLAIGGPMKGKRLEPIDSTSIYWFVWAAFHPDTDILDPSS